MITGRARILVLAYATFVKEPRALKQVQFLKDTHEVTTAGFGSTPFTDVRHVEIPEIAPQRWGLFGRALAACLLVVHWYRPLTWINALDRATARLLGGDDWDIVIAHDLKSLDAALALAPRYGVVLDLHEYAPRQEDHSFLWRLLIAPYFRWMCRTKVPQSAEVVTVSQGIVDEYKREFSINSTLVINATPYYELETGAVGQPLRIVHSGAAVAQRRLDVIIKGVLGCSADITLDLYLVGESATITRLKSLAGDDPRIRFHEPVPYRELIQTLNRYDIGVHLLAPVNFNHIWALPNKLFDYVQARLGVIVGPSPEMARVVEHYGFGLVLPDFEPSSLALALDALTVEGAMAWKAASAASAAALSSESQAEIWEELIKRVLAESQGAQ